MRYGLYMGRPAVPIRWPVGFDGPSLGAAHMFVKNRPYCVVYLQQYIDAQYNSSQYNSQYSYEYSSCAA